MVEAQECPGGETSTKGPLVCWSGDRGHELSWLKEDKELSGASDLWGAEDSPANPESHGQLQEKSQPHFKGSQRP